MTGEVEEASPEVANKAAQEYDGGGGNMNEYDEGRAGKKTERHSRSRSDSRSRRRRRSRRRSRSQSRSKSRSSDSDSRSRSRRRRRSRSRRRRDRSDSRDRYRRDRHRRRHGDSEYRRQRNRYDDDDYDRRGYKRDRRRSPYDRRGRVDRQPVEDEAAQLDRTMRTVQVYNLSLKADERNLFEFFSKAGPLVDIRIIKDRASGRSKGFAYVEFEKKDSIVPALSLTGELLLGQAVMVKTSEAEKNVAWEAAQAAKKQAALQDKGDSPLGRVKLSNVHPSLSEEFLKPIFEPFGTVSQVQVDRDDAGNSNGNAVIQFRNHDDAVRAVTELAGKIDIQGMVIGLQLEVPDAGNAGENGVGEATALDERLDVEADDGGGFRLSAQSRVALMNRLAANAGIEVPKMPTIAQGTVQANRQDDVMLEQGALGPASPIPTLCLLLKNAFDPSQESDPNWDEEIAADIKEECSKFGQVLFVHVDKNSKGFVYMKFGDVSAASSAQKALHGRWFNQRQLHAEFQFVPPFNSHFNL